MTKTAKQIMDEIQSEADFEKTVVEYAHLRGWKAVHMRTVKIKREDGATYYATPFTEDGEGFPDWIFTRERVIFAELKKEKHKYPKEQKQWRDWLLAAKQEYYKWKPSDWDEIVEVLK